eukprot:s4281_g2.t1
MRLRVYDALPALRPLFELHVSETPLHRLLNSVSHGSAPVGALAVLIEALLGKHADLLAQDSDGATPPATQSSAPETGAEGRSTSSYVVPFFCPSTVGCASPGPGRPNSAFRGQGPSGAGLATLSALGAATAASAARRAARAAHAGRHAREVRRRDFASLGGALLPFPGASAAPASVAPKLELPNFGVGAWAWGDRLFWGYDEKQDQDLRAGFETLINGDLPCMQRPDFAVLSVVV